MEADRAEFNVELDGDLLLQKYIAQRTVRGRELEILCVDEVHRGFVTGLDKTWMTITRSEDLAAELINRQHVTCVRETGRDLSEWTEDQQTQIRDYGAVFLRIAQREIARK